jgi:hypothetical protein
MARSMLEPRPERIRRAVAGALIATLAGLGASAQATVRNVPESYPTIQAAVDASAAGDTVLLSPGTYRGAGNKNVQFHGRDIVVTSRAGADATVIDCEWSGRGFCICENETRAARIEGLTIVDGEAPNINMSGSGGGINCFSASPTISDCKFVSNDARQSGGGLRLTLCSALVERCVFGNNYAALNGGGIFVDGSPVATVTHCVMLGNFAANGAGISYSGAWPCQLQDCTIVANYGTVGGGVDTSVSLTLERCIIWGNCSFVHGNEFYGGIFDLRCCDVDSSDAGGFAHVTYDANCVFTDPMFCAPEPCGWFYSGDWALSADSPCLPEHSLCGELIGALGQGCIAPAGTTGACCLADGSCRVVTRRECEDQHGMFVGPHTLCEPNPCQPTPIERTSWGRIKAAFR